MQQALLASATAYEQAVVFLAGVVHSSLNLDHILLTPGPQRVTAKVTGFEASQVLANNSRLSCQVADTLYTAPEVLLGNLTAAADGWSLGSVMCKLLVGQVPLNKSNGKLYCQLCL